MMRCKLIMCSKPINDKAERHYGESFLDGVKKRVRKGRELSLCYEKKKCTSRIFLRTADEEFWVFSVHIVIH